MSDRRLIGETELRRLIEAAAQFAVEHSADQYPGDTDAMYGDRHEIAGHVADAMFEAAEEEENEAMAPFAHFIG